MLDININKIAERSIKENVKDEKHFAKAITTKYKMSNTKNKNFVNATCFNILEIEEMFNLYTFLEELKKLNFSILPIVKYPNIFAIVKNDETRELKIGKILSPKSFL